MSVAKIVQGWIDPQQVDGASAAVEHDLIPRFVSQPGAQSAYWMADRDKGRVLIVLMWADDEAVRLSRAQDGATRAQMAERVGLRVEAVQTMEVVGAHEMAATTSAVSRWARATWVEGVKPGLDVDLSALHRDAVPDQMQSAGFCGSYWLANRGSGNGLALSFWEQPGHLESSGRGSRRRRRTVEQALGCRINLIEEYEALGAVRTDDALDLDGAAPDRGTAEASAYA
jgi:hypothetical protein